MALQVWMDDQIEDRAAFARFGDVHTFSGRLINAETLRAADALIVRSVTRVDRALLEGTAIRFVGTVTTGVDHIDVAYLKATGISFATAAGFNARPVAEYVLGCIFCIAEDRRASLGSMTLGIVGVGRIGSRIGRWAQSIGMRVLFHDPPLATKGHRGPWTSIDALLAQSDIVSLHVPFTRDVEHATSGLVDDRWLSQMKVNATLINTSRGGIVDETALLAALGGDRGLAAVIDTWAHEPDINTDLLPMCRIATPHIAGHSIEARARGGRMMRDALAAWLDSSQGHRRGRSEDAVETGHGAAGADDNFSVVVGQEARHDRRGDVDRLRASVAQFCRLEELDTRFRSAMAPGGVGFDGIRRQLGDRHEFGACVDGFD